MALTRRTQVLLDEESHERLRRRARATGSSVGALIREAIDSAYAEEGDRAARQARAGSAFLAAAPMELGDWEELEQELARGRDRGLDQAPDA